MRFVVTARSAPRSVNRQVGEIVAGKYKLEQQLGEGGMGVVFAARHMGTGRGVALKCMAPAANAFVAQARFKREAQAAGRIDHPNVVQVFDVGEDDRGRFIVMELLKGEALGDVLHERRLPPSDAIDLLMPALRGVHAAHRQGVVHRDLKPDNIFVCRADDGSVQIKVLDFGVSKLTLDADGGEDLTRTGILLGTPQYMSPERVRGQGDSDKRADVYALGVILFEALTGHRPFDSEQVPELVARIAQQKPPTVREFDASIPEALEAVVLRAMARRPQDRYEDVESLARALEPFAGEERFVVRRRDPTLGLMFGADAATGPRHIPLTETRRIGYEPFSRGTLFGAGAVLAVALLLTLTWLFAANEPAERVAAHDANTPSATSLTGNVSIPARPPLPPTPPPAHAAREPAAAPSASAAEKPRRPERAASPTPARPRAAPESSGRSQNRPRVARGVRTGGLSEQDF